MIVVLQRLLGADVPSWVRSARRPVLRATTFLGPRVLPHGPQIVFVSAHRDDPDALVILEFLARYSQRPLVWIGHDLPDTSLLGPIARGRVAAYRVEDLRGVAAFLTSALVLHTYGMFGVSRASRRQTVVNVWHGDGPKVMRPHPIATTFMVTGVRAFGARRMEVLGLPIERLLCTGRPRVDDLHRGYTADELAEAQARLGLDSRPIVWWLPTWREARLGATTLDADMTATFASAAFDRVQDRYQFVVKPHRNNPNQAWPAPWRVITAETIARSGVRWYRLLGEAAAIVTDYSSVSSDFLDAAVPLAFATPDSEAFGRDRGFYMENWREFLPGPLVTDADALGDFLSGLVIEDHAQQRTRAAQALGSNNGPGATARLFDALSARGVDWR